MPKRRSTAKQSTSSDPITSINSTSPPEKPTKSARPPLPNTSRTYGKVAGGKGGKPPAPKAFSHRKRG